jgi:ribosomal protein S18 acetylase RimI-like enzyme
MRISEAGPERLDDLVPMWRALHAHHASLPGEIAPMRPLEDSWRRRRAQYEGWLAGPGAVLLLAEEDSGPVGYAMVVVGHGPSTWDAGERTAELETLAVLPEARGSGVGHALMEAAFAAAKAAGAESMAVGVAHTNEGAIRFYEREGFQPFYVQLMRLSL